MARTATSYLKENLETYGVQLERWCLSLAEGGASKGSVANSRQMVRVFLARMTPVPPEGIDADVFRTVEAVMTDDGLSDRYRAEARVAMGRFTEFLTGDNPRRAMGEDCPERWFAGRLGEFLFRDELDAYLAELRSAGLSADAVRRRGQHVTTCCRVLEREMGVDSVRSIDVECMEHVRALTEDLHPVVAKAVLFALREFVRFTTGRDLKKAYTEALRRARDAEDTPEWRAMNEILEDYVGDMAERGLRPRTLAATRESVRTCYRRLTEVVGPVHPSAIDLHHMRILRREITGLRERTIRIYLSTLGKVLEFTYGVNPYHQAKLVWNPVETRRTWIFSDEWRRLWSVADVTGRLVLSLAGGMGLRRSEIAHLKVSDVGPTVMTIRGKGHGVDGKVVEKEIPRSVRRCIDDYMVHRREVIEAAGDHSEGNLIVMDSQRRGAPATPKYVEDVLHGLTERSRVYVTCHTLRRFYCTTLRDLGFELETIQRMMRHASPAVTLECYLHADPRRIGGATTAIDDALFG